MFVWFAYQPGMSAMRRGNGALLPDTDIWERVSIASLSGSYAGVKTNRHIS